MPKELSGGLGFHPHDSNQLDGERALLLVGLCHLRAQLGPGPAQPAPGSGCVLCNAPGNYRLDFFVSNVILSGA